MNQQYGLLVWFWAGIILARLLFSSSSAGPVAGVGEVLDFHSPVAPAATNDVSVSAQLVADPWSLPTRSCTLDVPTVLGAGGEMFVLAVRPQTVVVSWAGGRTALERADCRGQDSISITNASFRKLKQALANAT